MPPRPVTYQLRVSLKEPRPTIWHRFRMSPAWNLADLHDVVQAVWDGRTATSTCSIQFKKGRRRFSIPISELDGLGRAGRGLPADDPQRGLPSPADDLAGQSDDCANDKDCGNHQDCARAEQLQDFQRDPTRWRW